MVGPGRFRLVREAGKGLFYRGERQSSGARDVNGAICSKCRLYFWVVLANAIVLIFFVVLC